MSDQTWRVTGASVTGTSHINEGTECQDRFTWRTTSDGIFIAALADGAGSTLHGGIGASMACDGLLESLETFLATNSIEALTPEFGKHWVTYFQDQLINRAITDETDIREYSSTLAAAVLAEARSVFFQIGDSGILISGGDGGFEFAVDPEENEYVNMTSFLTDEDASEKMRIVELEERVSDLVMFSDGLETIAIDYKTGKPYEPFLRPMIAPLKNGSGSAELDRKLEDFLSSPALNEKTDDDKTLILASRANG